MKVSGNRQSEALFGLAALLVTGCGVGGAEQSEPRHLRAAPGVENLLLVTIDTLRADHVGAYGYERPTTPKIDRWARDAVVFRQAIASSSWTRTSMASVMSGLHPTTTGLTCSNFRVPKKECDVLPESVETLAEVLAGSDRETASVVANINVDRIFGFGQGFAELDVVMDRLAEQDPDWRLRDDWFDATTEDVTRAALAWLDGRSDSDRPFFLNVHYLDPHHPYEPPADHDVFGGAPWNGDPRAARPVEAYDGEIRFVDEQLAMIFDELERLGLEETTAVAIISDHGEEFLDHGGVMHGYTMYDEQIRVPFLLKVPGVTDGGDLVDQQVRMIDLMPTVLELLGVDSPEGLHGTSLVPMLHGESMPPLPALSERGYRPLVAWRAPPWKLIYDFETGRGSLYHLEDDPGERHDLADAEPRRVEDLTEELRGTLEQAKRDAERYLADSGSVSLTPEQIERLESLGYVDGS